MVDGISHDFNALVSAGSGRRGRCEVVVPPPQRLGQICLCRMGRTFQPVCCVYVRGLRRAMKHEGYASRLTGRVWRRDGRANNRDLEKVDVTRTRVRCGMLTIFGISASSTNQRPHQRSFVALFADFWTALIRVGSGLSCRCIHRPPLCIYSLEYRHRCSQLMTLGQSPFTHDAECKPKGSSHSEAHAKPLASIPFGITKPKDLYAISPVEQYRVYGLDRTVVGRLPE